jgi:hypothetical protein
MADDATLLTIPQSNDVTLTFMVTDPNNGNAPFSLTGCTLLFTRKKNRYLPDTDPSAKTYTVTADPDQVGNPGKATVAIPALDNATYGLSWCRLDVTKTGKLRTANTWRLELEAV